ncbi:MAG: ribonuclease III [Gammaproteobacteria bacterium]|nr:ribonuclease III [Gammaproteobacteria bacterium]
MNDLKKLETRLGYQFRHPDFLETALTHRSANKNHYERMEFLGDAVLNLVISAELYKLFPQATEGELSRLRAHLVKGESLSKIASELSLGDYLRLGSGELKSGGYRRKSILADVLESIIGAIYLDAGFAEAQAFIVRVFADKIVNAGQVKELKDPKTRLQEYLQAKALPLPTYEVVKTTGQAHNQHFEVSCSVTLLNEPVHGSGSSRRKAEQAAAEQVLELIDG